MGSMSIFHWLILAVPVMLVGIPVAKILKRLGFSRWWTILAFLPLANLVGLWILAFIDWPRQRPE
jgi:hypothetical protein